MVSSVSIRRAGRRGEQRHPAVGTDRGHEVDGHGVGHERLGGFGVGMPDPVGARERDGAARIAVEHGVEIVLTDRIQ